VRVVFFGTPDFAVPSLRALLGEGFDVAAVVTQPDRPHGRSRSRLVPPPVKVVAQEEGLGVLQPEMPSQQEFIDELRGLGPFDLGVVVAYGHILKPAVLEIPAKGMVNVHASLLPKLRGAAPIEHAILEGFEDTGVSIMQMEAGMDTGPVLHTVSTPIAADETGGELTVRLAELGALALVEALALIDVEAAHPIHQDDEHASYAPKITREITRIRWDELKLFGPQPADEWEANEVPGQVVETDPAFVVATGEGALQFLDVQPAGAHRMAAREWLRGRGCTKGDRLG
jgi:methionyl-tRNA formyltransferase